MLEDEIATYLLQAGLGTPDVDLFEIRSPDKPDSVIVVRGYPGLPPGKTQGTPGISLEHPNLQITVRDPASDVAMNRAMNVYKALQIVRNQLLSGVRYMHITPLSQPGLIGFDQNGRTEVGFNSQVEKEVSL